MSDHEHRPRDHDHLVEPMYQALEHEREGPAGDREGGGRGCLLLLPLLLAGIARRALES